MMFNTNQTETAENKWRYQLDRFVKNYQQELAAVAWGLWLEDGNSQGTIGIDLQPQPHFVYCPQDAIENLNDKVDNRLQELLGIIENYKPESEVVMIAIGKGEVKLIYFEPETTPPNCFQQLGKEVDVLLDFLEIQMREQLENS